MMLYFPKLTGLARTWCHPVIMFIINLWLKAARLSNTRSQKKYRVQTAIIIINKTFSKGCKEIRGSSCANIRMQIKMFEKPIRSRFQVNLLHDWQIRLNNFAFILIWIKHYQRMTNQLINGVRQKYNFMSSNSNTTMNGTQPPSCFSNPTAGKIGITFSYCLILIISLSGNTLVEIMFYETDLLIGKRCSRSHLV